MAHAGAATLCRLVLLYTFAMATRECDCGIIIRAHPNAMGELRRHQKHCILRE